MGHSIITVAATMVPSPRRPPHSIFFRALHALAVDHTGGRAGLPAKRLAALHIQRVVDLLDRPVVVPAGEVVMHRALWRQVLGDVSPLATSAQHIHHAV